MDQWASMISAIASLIGSLGGVGAFLYAARKGSRREREGAAEHVVTRLAGAGTPDHPQALEEAIEYLRHHPEVLHHDHEPHEPQHAEGER